MSTYLGQLMTPLFSRCWNTLHLGHRHRNPQANYFRRLQWPISTAAWTPIFPDRTVTTFAFGCADVTIFVYKKDVDTR